MFTCFGTKQGLAPGHPHDTVTDAKYCYGILSPTPTYQAPAPVVAPIFGSKKFPNGPLSSAQYAYIRDLHGDLDQAARLSYAKASEYIKELIALKNGTSVPSRPEPAPVAVQPPPPPAAPDIRLPMIEMLLGSVPEGYYAASADDKPLVFVRVSRPVKGRFAGSIKIQQLIGSGYAFNGRLEEKMVLWPSGRWSIYQRSFIDTVMLIITDHVGAGLAYAANNRRCTRCGVKLTDPESRHYGIGPECVQHRPDVVHRVEDSKGPYAHKSSRFDV